MSDAATLSPSADAPPGGAGDLYEVVEGRVVEPPEMGVFEVAIANTLAEAIKAFFDKTGRLGRVYVEMLFRIDAGSNLQRRPDVAFISFERWPRDRPVPRTAAWDVVPDLAVEVVSPNDTMAEVNIKVNEYSRAGVRQVWLIDPGNETAHVYVSPNRIEVLHADDSFDGGDLLPGFRLRLGDLLNESS
jgi:Uma2 family endonuclease